MSSPSSAMMTWAALLPMPATSPGDPHDVGGHRPELEQGILQQLLQPLHVPGGAGNR
jgi:hypothetical protein